MPKRRQKVHLRAFGQVLTGLRGERRSVEQIVKQLRSQHPAIQSNQGVISGYEQGYILKPDPVVLWGLSQAYGVPLEALAAVIHANRGNPHLSREEGERILSEHTHGPSPKLAQRALRKAATRLTDTLAEIAAFAEGIIPPGDGETKPRR